MTKQQITDFRSQLLEWFYKNKRNLPWRKDPSWYKTYLSEVILQQTTIEQGLPYFVKFLKRYPSIEKLAQADQQEILNLWAGLGYYSRARNMHKAAQIIVNTFNSQFPSDYKQALKIPGIGPYSASAILSIIYKKPLAVVDGNVIRVVSRLFAIKADVRLNKTLLKIKKKADTLLDKNNPGDFNEAVMELGAILCTPKNPKCSICPISCQCKSYEKNYIDRLPFKSPAKAKHKKYQTVYILKLNSKILIGRRPEKGLLAGMWELPAIEINKKEFENVHENPSRNGIKPITKSKIFRHIYSHIDLKYRAYTAKVEKKKFNFGHYIDHKWVGLDDIENFAIHNAHKKILKWYKEETLKTKTK